MEGLEEEAQHLLGVVLRKALELMGSSSYDVFDIPRRDVGGITFVHIIEKFIKCNGETTSCSKGTSIIKVVSVALS